jgi:hypothetical protein
LPVENAGEPEVGETGIAQRFQRGVIDVVELANAVFYQRAVFLTSFICVAKEANEELINSELRPA